MALDMTTFDAALKQHYTSDRVANMVYKDNPLLAMIAKMENFGGKNLPIPIIYGNPQGRSATFSTAVSNKGNSLITDFVLTRAKDYSLASIDNETLEASKGNANAFMEAATTEIDGAIQSATRSCAKDLFGNGQGILGAVVETSGTTITLSNAQDITNFEVGMEINFSDGTTIRDTGEAIGISTINRSAGTMIVDTDLNTISGITTLDSIQQEGDFGNKLKGLAAWIPYVAPTSTSFFGVNRGVDATRLGGIRYDGSAVPIEEALITLASSIAREGGKVDKCFMNYENFANVEKALGAKVQYVDVLTQDGAIGFRGIKIHGPRGPIDIIADQNCPNTYAWMLDMSSVKLYSFGKAVKILQSDGLKYLREVDADAVEVRVGGYKQMGFKAPGHNGIVKLN
jgi:hypothetical protein